MVQLFDPKPYTHVLLEGLSCSCLTLSPIHMYYWRDYVQLFDPIHMYYWRDYVQLFDPIHMYYWRDYVQLFDPIHMYYWRDYGAAV